MALVDTDADGTINLDEFLEFRQKVGEGGGSHAETRAGLGAATLRFVVAGRRSGPRALMLRWRALPVRRAWGWGGGLVHMHALH